MELNYYLVIIVFVLISISTACLSNPNDKISLSEAESFIGLKPLEEITNDEVWSMIEAQVFTYHDQVKASGSSYLIKDQKVTHLCTSGFGGYGISSSLSKQKEIDVGELFFDNDILKINLFNGIPEDIEKNLIEESFPLRGLKNE